MREGDVALTPLPQADGRIKNRPVVALRQMPPFGDWLVCGIRRYSPTTRRECERLPYLVEHLQGHFTKPALQPRHN